MKEQREVLSVEDEAQIEVWIRERRRTDGSYRSQLISIAAADRLWSLLRSHKSLRTENAALREAGNLLRNLLDTVEHHNPEKFDLILAAWDALA